MWLATSTSEIFAPGFLVYIIIFLHISIAIINTPAKQYMLCIQLSNCPIGKPCFGNLYIQLTSSCMKVTNPQFIEGLGIRSPHSRSRSGSPGIASLLPHDDTGSSFTRGEHWRHLLRRKAGRSGVDSWWYICTKIHFYFVQLCIYIYIWTVIYMHNYIIYLYVHVLDVSWCNMM